MGTDVEQGVVVPTTTTTTITNTVVDPSKINASEENKTVKQKLDAAKETNSGLGLFLAYFVILIGKIGCDILSLVVAIVPIAMIIVGAIHLHDCPACDFIPIYLLVGGLLGILNQIMNWMKCRSKIHEKESFLSSKFTHGYDFFVVVWFIVGSIWIYKTSVPNYIDPTNDNYCHKGTYLFAFWLITSTYILIFSLLILICCICAGVLFCSKADDE